MLDMIEHDSIYLKIRVLIMPKFLMCLTQYKAQGDCTNYLPVK